ACGVGWPTSSGELVGLSVVCVIPPLPFPLSVEWIRGSAPPRVLEQAVQGLSGQVEALMFVPDGEPGDDAEALRVSLERILQHPRGALVECLLGYVAEWWMTEIVGETARFDRVRVEGPNQPGGTARDPFLRDQPFQSFHVPSPDLRHLERVGQAVVEYVAGLGRGHLRDVGESMQRRAVEHPIAIALWPASVSLARRLFLPPFPLPVSKGRPSRAVERHESGHDRRGA